MKITDFARQVCEHEGKRQQLSIAQVAEVLRVVNVLMFGALYAAIRRM